MLERYSSKSGKMRILNCFSYRAFKIILECFLILLLIWITYSRLTKLWEEKTGLSYTMLDVHQVRLEHEHNLELPSLTGPTKTQTLSVLL